MEDTSFSEEPLRILFGDEIVDILPILTHNSDLSRLKTLYRPTWSGRKNTKRQWKN